MNFHIPTAMLLTAITTLIMGLSLAFTVTDYPRALQVPIRQWVRSLLVSPFAFLLFALRERIPDWASIVLANVLLIVSTTLLVQALRSYNRLGSLRAWSVANIAITLAAVSVMTYVWPSIAGRTLLVAGQLAVLFVFGIAAIYRPADQVTNPERMVASFLAVGVLVMILRMAYASDPLMTTLLDSTPMQSIVFTYGALMPVIATSGFLLMCGQRLNKDLARLATLDPLTEVFNRRTMTDLANKAVAASKRHGRPLSLLILDIDHFKRINDEFGHEAGDLALCRFVELVREMLRSSDVVARIGGEEFVVLLPDTDQASAAVLAERIRQHLHATEFTVSGWPVPLRVSIGVGSIGPEVSNLESLLREADHAMYEAKRTGRDRVVLAADLRAASKSES
ncbi:GGDEF domain-containing protein [Dokdonella sp.]|jgi:diguanylate cyclase (GGDEF)-like protein|uniref:GGDEF domain-containing protein n=1 Tax=Dokdonella sp. TaxID=2291710 RepID=UPI0037852D00